MKDKNKIILGCVAYMLVFTIGVCIWTGLIYVLWNYLITLAFPQLPFVTFLQALAIGVVISLFTASVKFDL